MDPFEIKDVKPRIFRPPFRSRASETMSWTEIHEQLMSNLDPTLSRSLMSLYDNNIPVILRRKYSRWFEDQPWPEAMVPEVARELYRELVGYIDRDISQLRTDQLGVFEAMELFQAKNKLEESFSCDLMEFVNAVMYCLDEEKTLISGYTGPEKMEHEDREQKAMRDKFRKELDDLDNMIMNLITVTNSANNHMISARGIRDDIEGLKADYQTMLTKQMQNGKRQECENFFKSQNEKYQQQFNQSIIDFGKTKQAVMDYLRAAMNQLNVLTTGILEEVNTFKQLQKLAYVRAESSSKVETLLCEVEDWCSKLGKSYWVLMTTMQNPNLVEVLAVSAEALSGERESQQAAIALSPDQQMLNSLREELLVNFQDILNKTFIVTAQPPDIIIMAKGGNGGSSRVPITSNVSILALNGLEIQQIASQVTAEFMAETDIGRTQRKVKCKLEGDKAQFMKSNASRCEAVFSELKVKQFERSNDRDKAPVSRQFYRIFYKTTVTLQSEYRFPLETVSLPIIKNTGSNQACEALGSLLWYCYNVDDVWNNLESAVFPEDIPLERVINMLNARLKTISSRELKEDERKFLSEKITGKPTKMLQEEYAPMPRVSFRQFCVNKMRINNSKNVEFSFWKWFHAVTNLINNHLKEPWKDGVIKGFVSRSSVERILKNQPEGTFLIRFSESCVNGDHVGVTGGFVVAFRCKDKVKYTPPVVEEHLLKASLLTILSQFINIERNAEPFLKTLYRSSCHKEPRESAFQKYNKIQCDKANYSNYPGWISLMGLESSLQDLVLDDRTYDSSQDIWKNNEQARICYPTPARPPATRSRAKRRRTSNEDSQSLSPPMSAARDSTMDSFSSNSPGSGNIPTVVQNIDTRQANNTYTDDVQSFLTNFINTPATAVPVPITTVPMQYGGTDTTGLVSQFAMFSSQQTQSSTIPQISQTDQMLQQQQQQQIVNHSSPQSCSTLSDYNTDTPSPVEIPQVVGINQIPPGDISVDLQGLTGLINFATNPPQF